MGTEHTGIIIICGQIRKEIMNFLIFKNCSYISLRIRLTGPREE